MAVVEANQLDSSEITARMETAIAARAKAVHEEFGIRPGLAILTDNESSQAAMRAKAAVATRLGLVSVIGCFSEAADLEDRLLRYNALNHIHGISLEAPFKQTGLAAHLGALIAPDKDVNRLNPESSFFQPALPLAIMALLSSHRLDYKHGPVAILASAERVGTLLLSLMRSRGVVDVEIFDTSSEGLSCVAAIKQAGIIISATRDAGSLTSEMLFDLREPKLLIDTGIIGDDGMTGSTISPEFRAAALEQNWQIISVADSVSSLADRALLLNTVRASELFGRREAEARLSDVLTHNPSAARQDLA